MNDSFVKPFFMQRLGAFLLDIMIVAFVASLIGGFFIDQKAVNKIQSEMLEIQEKYIAGEVNINTYTTESFSLSYQLSQKQGFVSLISIFLTIMYFIVYQFKNNGQTLGKKLFKIKVSKYDSTELTINNMIFRALIINSIFVNMIVFLFITISNFNIYFYGSIIFRFIDYVLLIVSLFMIMWNKNGRGIHDYIAGTVVVRTNEVKERELCEN